MKIERVYRPKVDSFWWIAQAAVAKDVRPAKFFPDMSTPGISRELVFVFLEAEQGRPLRRHVCSSTA
jgi:hypothetical protein